MTKPTIVFSLLILLCFHSPAEVANQTPRTTTPPDFYQVIIDNNLFRPLGWTKPKTAPAFELVATVMKSDGNHKALIRYAKSRTLHYAAIGEELAPGVTLEKVEPRAVTLTENGTSKAYHLSL